MIGLPEVLIILIIALLILGPKKLPSLARAIGKSVREYRKAVEGEGKKKKTIKRPAG
ncbi:MAG TPA: twin-arginine translocase TatA/TatE family subunit [Candidatus Aenigmarchaeota archaeon]|nr:twin-arginine translocase TatA/TatE family subunit [Candidatus Aenigmarchaeota archaeon]